MSYPQEGSAGAVIPVGSGVLAADDLSATGVHGEYMFCQRGSVKKLMAAVTTVLNGPAVITFRKRVTTGSATGASVLGTITIPTATAVGKVMYKEIDPVDMAVGDCIAFDVTTAATSGGAIYAFLHDLDPEVNLNEGDLVASV